MPPTPLPTSHVLSYLTTAGTPTRVRQLAALGVAACSWVFLFAFLAAATLSAQDFLFFYHHYPWLWAGSRIPLLPALYRFTAHYEFPGSILLASTFALFLATRNAVRPIRRGRPWACFLAAFPLLAAAATALCAAGLLASFAIGALLGLLALSPNPTFLLLLLPAALLTLATLILLDLLRFLSWIARNPYAEKPPTPFLPALTPPAPPAASTPPGAIPPDP
ncbi:MAG TPA: hypothetical protein VHQ47_07135 [Phycisphaerae bacterium]|nr:hypothetical protein [Phycisphaerae bacterium]